MRTGWITMLLFGRLGMATPAFAAEYYLEGPAQGSRSTASEQAKRVPDPYKGRVVRRYRQGEGWQYLLRIEGFEEEQAAREAAEQVAASIGHPVAVYAPEGDGTREIARAEPGADPNERTVEAITDDPAEILARSVKAHGGAKGGTAAILGSERVVFAFRRTLPTGLVVEHTWARRDGSRFLDIEVVAGEGRSSKLLLGPEAAWLAVDGGPLEPTDLARARETLAAFDPDQVVPFVLVFADAVENRREFDQLRIDRVEESDGHKVVVLAFDGGRSSGPMTIKVDARTWQVAEVAFDGAELVHRFGPYKDEGGVVFPSEVRTWRRGELVDTVTIETIDVRANPPEAWFEAG